MAPKNSFLSSAAKEALKILASLPDPPPIELRAQYAAVLTFAVMSQAALTGAIQTMRARKPGSHPTKKLTKRPRRLVLKLGKGRGRAVIVFDDGGADGGTDDPGTDPVDAGETTAGTEVDVDPPTDSPDPSSLGDAISSAADALGEAINEIDVGETVDEIFNTLMNEGAMP
jgi:hypothetical protein